MKEEYVATGRAEQKSGTRKKILETAKELLMRGGDFTLEDVAKEAGISRATIYRYYSKINVLNAESALHIQAIPPAQLIEQFSSKDVQDKLLAIHNYYNTLAFDNEAAYRKYLSVVINDSGGNSKRGARRVEALRLALGNQTAALSKKDLDRLVNVTAVLTGIEALIVTKDVCGLEEKEARETLTWGLEMILKSVMDKD